MNIKNIWKFLGLTQETIGRRRFLIAFFSAQWGLPLSVLLVMGLFYLVFGKSPILFLPAIVLIASLIFGFVVYIKICIRRVRDIGIARSWWVLAIIPFINIPFFIYLCLKKGTTRQLTDDSKINLFTQQFKSFFAKKYSKPLIINCFCLIVAGILYAGFTAYNLKSNIDVQITEREQELDILFDEKDRKSGKELAGEINRWNQACQGNESANLLSYCYESYVESFRRTRMQRACGENEYCAQLVGYTPTVFDELDWERTNRYRYTADETYRKLNHIKDVSTFQIFTESFDRFNFGWLGVIVGTLALIFVFIINILIIVVKFLRRPASMFIGTAGTHTAQTKDNINKMPAFQRYLLLIALLILITLVFVLIKL